MTAVFRRELRSYFNNVFGFVFGAFILLFVGIYVLVYNLNAGYTNFEYVLGSMGFVFIVAVPILTMRVLAEERKQKTDQLLYSLPISMTKVVIGKYLAMLVMLIIPTLIICIYPIILSAYGNIYLPASYSAAIAFFFLGASLIAIGTFISSITENQAVAAGICFAVMLLSYFLASLSGYVSTDASASFIALIILVIILAVIVRVMTRNSAAAILAGSICVAGLIVVYVVDATVFENLFPTIMADISVFERFYVFIDGVFDLTGIVYSLSLIGLFIFLSIQSMEKRRWS